MKTEGKLEPEPLPASHDMTFVKAHCPRREPELVLAFVEINGSLTLTCSLPRMSLVVCQKRQQQASVHDDNMISIVRFKGEKVNLLIHLHVALN